MVLSCEYDHFHACRFHGFAPLVGIQLFQIKDAGIFHAVSPLHAGKGIGTEMDESDEFIFKSFHLHRAGNNMCGFLHNAFRGVCTFYRYRVLARQGQVRATLLGTGCKEHAYAEKTAV